MLSLVIMLLLVFGFFIGRRRGFILQLIHLVAFLLLYLWHGVIMNDSLAPFGCISLTLIFLRTVPLV